VSLDNINIANYCCDFGNVVVGATKKRSFRFTNTGRLPINFAFDKKILANYGINIEPDKVQKLAPNQSVLFNVVYATRKNAKFGKVKSVVPIDLKYGPSYAIEFVANLTIPELTMSTDNLDFQKVVVGTRKTIKIRLENHKEVPCDWQYFYKPDVSASKEGKEAGERFQVVP
jgi:Abnormal spindle-like microcephaly-assoc'd, ASPM-SPD-2-Hydin